MYPVPGLLLASYFQVPLTGFRVEPTNIILQFFRPTLMHTSHFKRVIKLLQNSTPKIVTPKIPETNKQKKTRETRKQKNLPQLVWLPHQSHPRTFRPLPPRVLSPFFRSEWRVARPSGLRKRAWGSISWAKLRHRLYRTGHCAPDADDAGAYGVGGWASADDVLGGVATKRVGRMVVGFFFYFCC